MVEISQLRVKLIKDLNNTPSITSGLFVPVMGASDSSATKATIEQLRAVRQIQTASVTSVVSTTSLTNALLTGLSISITPSSVNSKFLIDISINGISCSGTGNYGTISLGWDSTSVIQLATNICPSTSSTQVFSSGTITSKLLLPANHNGLAAGTRVYQIFAKNQAAGTFSISTPAAYSSIIITEFSI